MSTPVYPELFGSSPWEWVAYYGEGVCGPDADPKEMYIIFYLDSADDYRLSLSGSCGVCASDRIHLAALAIDAYGGSMRVCLRCLEQSGVMCDRCQDALVVGEAETWVEVWAETPKQDALLDVCEPCRNALAAQEGDFGYA